MPLYTIIYQHILAVEARLATTRRRNARRGAELTVELARREAGWYLDLPNAHNLIIVIKTNLNDGSIGF